jgi:hypothetical protein
VLRRQPLEVAIGDLQLINARVETVAQRAPFRALIRRRHGGRFAPPLTSFAHGGIRPQPQQARFGLAVRGHDREDLLSRRDVVTARALRRLDRDAQTGVEFFHACGVRVAAAHCSRIGGES